MSSQRKRQLLLILAGIPFVVVVGLLTANLIRLIFGFNPIVTMILALGLTGIVYGIILALVWPRLM